MEIVIKAEKLKKAYGGLQAVKGLDIEVTRGEVFGLLGANGAGKTTSIECILGTKKQDSGTTSVLGLDPRKNRKELFQRVGVQFQESHYQDNILVKELCEITASLYRSCEDYRKLLENMQLLGKLKSPVKSLSGGEKQRLFIVLALIPNPEVVFLDELTTGLDTKARRDVWKYLIGCKKNGLTIFLSSHYMDEVETLCNRICILKNGENVFTGTVQNAINESPYDTLEDAYLYFSGEEVE